MTSFDRRFEFPVDLSAAPSWWADLLSLWAPAGTPVEGSGPGLRLAIRNGSLNFYRRGQSVAKVIASRGVLRAEVHTSYVPEWATRSGRARRPYATLSEENLCFAGEKLRWRGRGQLEDWVRAIDAGRPTGQAFCGPEKTFVDRLVGANETVVDLEMGIPRVPQKRGGITVLRDGRQVFVAPRMDLVLLEQTPGGKNRLVFWEAKMMSNGELRALGPNVDPPVITQLGTYADWLREDDHLAAIVGAYRRCCSTLADLHHLASRANPTVGPLSERIVAFGTTDSTSVSDAIDRKRCPDPTFS